MEVNRLNYLIRTERSNSKDTSMKLSLFEIGPVDWNDIMAKLRNNTIYDRNCIDRNYLGLHVHIIQDIEKGTINFYHSRV